MSYLNSTNVRVFPSIGRHQYQPDAPLMHEGNITNILKVLNPITDSFVIDYNTSTHLLKFVIHGYYFEVFTTDTNFPNISGGTGIYAHVHINDKLFSGDENNYQYLKNLTGTGSDFQDFDYLDVETSNTWTFYGVEFVTGTAPANNNQDYYLQLFNTSGAIPETSLTTLKALKLKAERNVTSSPNRRCLTLSLNKTGA